MPKELPDLKGQLFLRDAGVQHCALDKRIVVVTGLVGVPADLVLPFEHQITALGVSMEGGFSLICYTKPPYVVDRSVDAKGLDAAAVLTQPWWRV